MSSLKKLYWKLIKNKKKFPGSAEYWEQRYAKGGNSGDGSYDRLAEFKAEILNQFVVENKINRVMEFGCGDGNQLSLGKYPEYIGLDISSTVIKHCMKKYGQDKSKSFFVYDSLAFSDFAGIFTAELTLSLDVLYHLIEQSIFESYLRHLFGSSSRFVIIYAGNFEKSQTFHEKDRVFTEWIEKNIQGWELVKVIENKYKYNPAKPNEAFTSKADFFIYKKKG